jgi:SOS response regulatory protein OraA/RecX
VKAARVASTRNVDTRPWASKTDSKSRLTEARLQQLALRYLTGRDRTEAQLTAYLLRKGASPDQLRPLLQRFQDLGYLDDARYAFAWAQARLRAKPMGRARLEMELRRRGVPRLLARVTVEQLYAEHDEVELARLLLSQRDRERPTRLTFGMLSQEARHAARRRAMVKTAALLQRHGFGAEVIRSILRARST